MTTVREPHLKTGARVAPLSARLVLLVFGLFVFALGIVLTLRSGMGLGPWDVLHDGLSRRLPITFGQAGIAVGASLLLLNVCLGERPGIGTIANAVMIGLYIDALLFLEVVPNLADQGLLARLAMDVVGVGTIGVGSALYIKAALGAGPRDGLMLVLTRRTRQRVGLIRTAIELTALLAGWLLGGTAGVGTAIFALGIGPAVEAAFRTFRVGPHSPPDGPPVSAHSSS